ncbi:hypothetical protein KR222_007272, partial [Zaprionus bogoriensis]
TFLTKSEMSRAYNASVIFLHGVGDTGNGIMDWVRSVLGRDFRGSHIQYVYPTAPMQKYTPFSGEHTNVWYNRLNESGFDEKEDKETISNSYSLIHNLIRDIEHKGIAAERIIVGGFSQGGALALHTGYHIHMELCGVFAHSAYLNHDSEVFDSLKSNSDVKVPELRMYHGTDDAVVSFDWGKKTYERMRELGVSGSFTTLNGAVHELHKSALVDIEEFILDKLP